MKLSTETDRYMTMEVNNEIIMEVSSEEKFVQRAEPKTDECINDKTIYAFFKRSLDIILSFIGLIVLLIPLLMVALIIALDCPGASPIYVQDRVGKSGQIFKLYKFRSMVPNAECMLDLLLEKNEMEGPAFKIKNDPRITRVGHFIRKTGIDELPQLWNVLKGDMSLVGPRPPLPREVAVYTSRQLQRLSVTPGITCYWQVQPQRYSLPFDEWLALDLKYISECSFKTDIIILFKTVGAVCGMEGE